MVVVSVTVPRKEHEDLWKQKETFKRANEDLRRSVKMLHHDLEEVERIKFNPRIAV